MRDIRKKKKHEEEHEQEESYYTLVRVGNFWNNNYIEYESNGNRNKPQSVEKYLHKIRSNLKDIIDNLNKSDTWKILENSINNNTL